MRNMTNQANTYIPSRPSIGKRTITAVLLLLSGSRIELWLQQEAVVKPLCVAEQGPTYLDSGELSKEEAEEVRTLVKTKRGK